MIRDYLRTQLNEYKKKRSMAEADDSREAFRNIVQFVPPEAVQSEFIPVLLDESLAPIKFVSLVRSSKTQRTNEDSQGDPKQAKEHLD